MGGQPSAYRTALFISINIFVWIKKLIIGVSLCAPPLSRSGQWRAGVAHTFSKKVGLVDSLVESLASPNMNTLPLLKLIHFHTY